MKWGEQGTRVLESVALEPGVADRAVSFMEVFFATWSTRQISCDVFAAELGLSTRIGTET